MGRGDNLSTTSNYGEHLVVVLVHDPLDPGARYDTREGKFENGYHFISRDTTTFHGISGGEVRIMMLLDIFYTYIATEIFWLIIITNRTRNFASMTE